MMSCLLQTRRALLVVLTVELLRYTMSSVDRPQPGLSESLE